MKIQELIEDSSKTKLDINKYVANTFGINSRQFEFTEGKLKLKGHCLCIDPNVKEFKIPITFARSMYISSPLTSLKNGPREIENGFVLQKQHELKDLSFSPEFIGGNFVILDSDIHSLDGITQKCKSFEFALCRNLTSIEGLPREINHLKISECKNITDLSQVFDHVTEIKTSLIITGEFIENLSGFHRILKLDKMPEFINIYGGINGTIILDKIISKYIDRIKKGENRSVVLLDFQDELSDRGLEKFI